MSWSEKSIKGTDGISYKTDSMSCCQTRQTTRESSSKVDEAAATTASETVSNEVFFRGTHAYSEYGSSGFTERAVSKH